MIDLSEIRAAADRIDGKLHRTPLFHSRTLGDAAGVEFYLKCECFQKTGSFKPRGALNKVLSLSESDREKGLITVSAGNHAQAVAWAAKDVGVVATVVMPTDAPQSKVDAVRSYGGRIIFHKDRATLFDRVNSEQKASGATFIHPFDDRTVLAGAGTAGLEIVEDLPDVDVIFVPVGGGGLLGGVASAVKALRPEVKVVAVELAEGPALQPAMDAGKPVTVDRPMETLADGMTPPYVGELPLKIARSACDAVISISEDELCASLKLILTRCKLVSEGSGAAATAGFLSNRVRIERGSTVAAIVSGGNIDVEKLTRLP